MLVFLGSSFSLLEKLHFFLLSWTLGGIGCFTGWFAAGSSMCVEFVVCLEGIRMPNILTYRIFLSSKNPMSHDIMFLLSPPD